MLKLLKKLGKKEWLFLGLSLIFIVSQVWLDLKLPDYMAEITTLLQTEGTTVSQMIEPGLYMLGCALGSLISAFIVGYFASYIATSFSKNVRKDLFRKVNNLGEQEIKEFSTSSLITRTSNDVTQVQSLVAMAIQMLIKAPIMAVWAITKISGKSWQWGGTTAIAIVLLLIMIITLILFALPKFKIVQKLTDNLNKITRENLTGIRVVRAYNAEEYQEKKFENANNDLTKTQAFTQKLMGIMSPFMSFIMSMLTLIIYFIGANLINDALMIDKIGLFSDMVVFSSYAMQVIMAFMMLAMMFIIYPRASVSAKRINEVLDTEESIIDGNIKENKSNSKGKVEFKNVFFKYPDAEEYLLKDISFEANIGETIAFIGSTGSGKSTLINLIPRLYDVTDGEVLVNGINVKEYNQEFLRNKIGFVTQHATLFSGTIKSNTEFGDNGQPEITDQQISKAIKIAQGSEFVENLAEKHNSHVAQGGTNFSGGQKQRISIARAIARNPEIYIFDDSFSALDYKTDYALRKELKKYTNDATTLIVAQRIGTIKDADKIIVLDEGECVGIGTHKELLKNCQVYQEIALSQLSKEELANG